MTTLDAYLAARKLSGSEFAARLGVSTATVSRLRRGKQTPSLTLAVRIERETGGKVKPSVFQQPDLTSERAA